MPAARLATGQGQVAPFSLLTYDQARRWAASIAEVIADGRMPPWHADPRYGHFANDRSLSARERSLLDSPGSNKALPAGELSSAPEPPKFPQGWSIGTPDLIFEMPEPFSVQAEGTLAHPAFPHGDHPHGGPLDPGRRSSPRRSGRRSSYLRLHR